MSKPNRRRSKRPIKRRIGLSAPNVAPHIFEQSFYDIAVAMRAVPYTVGAPRDPDEE